MIIAPDRSWCYLGPPKTGSTTLTALLQGEPFWGQYSGHQHDMTPPEGIPVVFASVRDPWARVLSLWRHRQGDLARFAQATNHFVERLSLDRFVQQVVRGELEEFFSWPLSRWLWGVSCRIVCLERLGSDLAQVLPSYNWGQISIPQLNPSDTPGYTTTPFEYGPTCDLIREWAAGDFERFGYSRETPR